MRRLMKWPTGMRTGLVGITTKSLRWIAMRGARAGQFALSLGSNFVHAGVLSQRHAYKGTMALALTCNRAILGRIRLEGFGGSYVRNTRRPAHR